MKNKVPDHVEARLHRISAVVLDAVMERWQGQKVALSYAEQVNALLPLRLYFIEVGRFVCREPMDEGVALYFRERLSYPDALELIFEDAARVMLAKNFTELDGHELALFLTIRATVKWMTDAAYYLAPMLCPQPSNQA